MLYITTEKIDLKGTYEEPIYDHAPGYGTYFSDKEFSVLPLTGIELDSLGNVTWCDIDEQSFGVSMHPGTLAIETNLRDRIGSGLVPISDCEWESVSCCLNNIAKVKQEKRELKLQIIYLECDVTALLDEACSASKTLSHDEYETVSERIWDITRDIMRKEFTLMQLEAELKAREVDYHWYLDKFRTYASQ